MTPSQADDTPAAASARRAFIEIARLSPIFRGPVTISLTGRTPALLDVSPIAPLLGFNENIPLRDQPPEATNF